jgi:hypothetical protein
MGIMGSALQIHWFARKHFELSVNNSDALATSLLRNEVHKTFSMKRTRRLVKNSQSAGVFVCLDVRN